MGPFFYKELYRISRNGSVLIAPFSYLYSNCHLFRDNVIRRAVRLRVDVRLSTCQERNHHKVDQGRKEQASNYHVVDQGGWWGRMWASARWRGVRWYHAGVELLVGGRGGDLVCEYPVVGRLNIENYVPSTRVKT